MTILTGDTVVSAISTAIRAGFTTDEIKNIYKNTPKQGLIAPCAFIHLVNTQMQNELRGRGTRSFLFDIRLHQTQDFDNFETWSRNISERLFYVLNPIVIDGLYIKPWRMESRENTDNNKIMHNFFTYNFKVRVIHDEIPMEILELTERVKD